MPRATNFLLGRGERLTQKVEIRRGGGDKNPPYTIDEAKARISANLVRTNDYFSGLPSAACPLDTVVGVVTMHPRYTAKTSYPENLLDKVGLKTLGSRARPVQPDKWGIEKIPESGIAVTEEFFVAGNRQAFLNWGQESYDWPDDGHRLALAQLAHIEIVSPFLPEEKIRGLPAGRSDVVLEVVLHANEYTSGRAVIEQFEAYAHSLGCKPVMDRLKTIEDLTFLPVRADVINVRELAEFSLLRVARGMPTLRPLRPDRPEVIRIQNRVILPDADSLQSEVRTVIFDGGLPKNHGLSRWVNYIEPPGIGKASPNFQAHGLGVTSAFLFGPLAAGETAPAPVAKADHVRVLDENTGQGDLDCYDVLDRITSHLDANSHYAFVSLSLGPDLPVEDDDISRWTAEIDARAMKGSRLIAVAVGNNGDMDRTVGNHRVQAPSDGVNVLSVGATNGEHFMWQRANYSAMGPGRNPGLVKPDGVAFGGDGSEPFNVLSARGNGTIDGFTGTSVATPYTLRSCVYVPTALGDVLTPLAIRTLAIHRAETDGRDLAEVGWGRFETEPDWLITCDDDEAITVYQGELPVGEYIRALVPLPDDPSGEFILLSATLVIAPDIDPAFANAYTRSGVEVLFRPDQDNKRVYKNGATSEHGATTRFFSPPVYSTIGVVPATADAFKWEICKKGVHRFALDKLNQPSFDIYHHRRIRGGRSASTEPMPYALVITTRMPGSHDYYNKVVRTYAGVLEPLRAVNRLQVRHPGR